VRVSEEAGTSLVSAIDGPSGSGKSSAARGVARRLGLRFLDTGAMYRAACWSAIEDGLDPGAAASVARLVRDLELTIGTDPDHPTVAVNGIDVSDAIRRPEISASVSKIAVNLDVRAELIQRQRDIIQASGGIVVEGRDITTVVAPDADVRILLTASEEVRMNRRGSQLGEGAVSDSDLRDQVVRRDRDDSTVAAFTTAADGVVTLDSTGLTLEQVIDFIAQRATDARHPVSDDA
jgi:cytidylate kinase